MPCARKVPTSRRSTSIGPVPWTHLGHRHDHVDARGVGEDRSAVGRVRPADLEDEARILAPADRMVSQRNVTQSSLPANRARHALSAARRDGGGRWRVVRPGAAERDEESEGQEGAPKFKPHRRPRDGAAQGAGVGRFDRAAGRRSSSAARSGNVWRGRRRANHSRRPGTRLRRSRATRTRAACATP